MAAPLYLFTGPEAGVRSDAVNELFRMYEKKLGTVELHRFYTSETSVADVISLLMNGSLFASFRFVVLNNAEAVKKKEDIELISEWLASNDGNSALVLLSDEISIEKKLENLVPKENKKIFWELFQDKKESWVRSLFQRNGFRITDDAIEAVLELCENDTASLKRECERFFVCFEKDHVISADDVENLLSHNREENAFTLFDAMTEQCPPAERLENSLDILQKIRLSKESDAIKIIAGLTYSYRKLLTWISLAENGVYDNFQLKIKGFGSKKMQDEYRRAARLWNKDDTAQILALLAKTDISLRSGGAAFEDTLLQMLIYSIVIKKGAPVEAYEDSFAF
ncbi:MAG: DNA polymerase III subunit delta [Spirochaetaceae bacterium]|nr:DNA polymerase III subunit delta [Spirochaetaceae bacterium]MBP5792541.1 DNA polymerase III subunit delta [Spirochaetaceae bacterium]